MRNYKRRAILRKSCTSFWEIKEFGYNFLGLIGYLIILSFYALYLFCAFQLYKLLNIKLANIGIKLSFYFAMFLLFLVVSALATVMGHLLFYNFFRKFEFYRQIEDYENAKEYVPSLEQKYRSKNGGMYINFANIRKTAQTAVGTSQKKEKSNV